jgi:galactokinase
MSDNNNNNNNNNNNEQGTSKNISDIDLSPSLSLLVSTAKKLYQDHLFTPAAAASDDGADRLNNDDAFAWVTVAPGRVNLIGEHTDYTGGFVLPLAIDYSTVVYGTGSLELLDAATHRGSVASASIRFLSSSSAHNDIVVEEAFIDLESMPPTATKTNWTTYVIGTVFQYLVDLPKHSKLNLVFSIAGDVPLGAGLSSSASLEVAVARFVECVLGDHAFSSSAPAGGAGASAPKLRAIRCQKAENTWCHSPCGIMDQYVSSAATLGALLLIDCRSLEYQETKLASQKVLVDGDDGDGEMPVVLVVANSHVQHDIAGGEYPVRVAQCKTATELLQQFNSNIQSLRDATLEDIQRAQELGLFNDNGDNDNVSYKRSKHVVTENNRTLLAKDALEQGDWKTVGDLMNASHASMRDDYQVSCEEIDILVELAQAYPNGVVYGSRLTGGGFGGCTVTLVKQEHAKEFMSYLKQEYKTKTGGKECTCFETRPAMGARLLGTDAIQVRM